MARVRIIATLVAVTAAALLASKAVAVVTTYNWNPALTGAQNWQQDGNWDLANFPNLSTDVANVSVALGAGLTLNTGASDVTAAGLNLGGTTAAVTTNVTSGGGRLVFQNTDADMPPFNDGNALITSGGVTGSTNTISAVVGLNDGLDIAGTNNITLAGGVEEMAVGASLNAVSPTATAFVTGNVTTVDTAPTPEEEDVPLALNVNSISQGTLDVSGVIMGGGRVQLGAAQPVLPQGTVILRGNNTYSGRTILSRGNAILAHDNALGTGDAKHAGPANQVGYNLLSDNDSRIIANDLIFAQWQTIKGEHSLTWAGIVYQDNARGWINMLPAGKTLTLSGGQFPNHTEENPPLPGRFLTVDGTGKTLITGGLHDEWSAMTQMMNPGNFVGSFRFRGTGTVVVSGGNSTYTGSTNVEGSNLHFATNADFGNTAEIASSAGAVGVDAGVVGNSDFVSKLNSSANPLADAAGNLVVWDRGGLMLGTSEYGMNLDFTSGSLANAADMSLAAHETGSTYTGTITPAENTYRLGGGSGTLTLPNPNQLTGARNLVATNGGEVNVTGSNNYTGTTSVIAKFASTLQEGASRDTVNFNDGDNIPNDQLYIGTTLTANALANGGVASSIGSSTSAASNLYIQGSTLKYVGAAASTDRLFTIGSGGATIDASGTGALNLTNTGALGVDIAEQRTGNVNAFATGNGANDRATVRNLPTTEDLQPGMPIMASGILAGATITRIASASDVTISIPTDEFAFFLNTPITFGPAPERKLTLAGTNTGSNTLAAVIPDASDGGLVGVTKAGDGKWILSGNNSYTGTTTVNAGTLLVNGTHSGAGAVTVDAGGTLGGTGTLTGAVTNNGTINAGTSVGTLALNGGLVMGADSHLAVELLGATADNLAITGNLDLTALGNALDVIDLGKTGTSWIIATYTGLLSGVFETMTSGYSVDYGSGSNSQVTLNFSGGGGVPGDYNQNGVVDTADYVVWRNSVGAGSLPNEGGISPGVVDTADYNFWRSRFGATSGSGTGSVQAAVPEPASWLLACLAMVGMTSCTRRRGERPS